MNQMNKNIDLIALKNAFFYNKIDELSNDIFIDFMSEFEFNKIYLQYFIDNLRDVFSNSQQNINSIKNNCIKILNKFYTLDNNNIFSENEQNIYLYWCFSNFALNKIIESHDVVLITELVQSIENIININLNNTDMQYAILNLKLNLLLFYNILLSLNNDTSIQYYNKIIDLVQDIKDNQDFMETYRSTQLR